MSNDNPYSEAWNKTLKYAPPFPQRFTSLPAARVFMGEFVDYYNHHHRHSGTVGVMCDDPTMNWVGWVGVGLQLLGSLAVLLGLWDTWESMKKRGVTWHYDDRLTHMSRWIRRNILRKPYQPHGTAAGTFGLGELIASGYVLRNRLPDVASPEFPAAVQREFDHLVAEISLVRQELALESKARERQDGETRNSLDRQKTDLEEQIQEVDAGGLRLEALGLFFVVVGTVVSSLASM